jgi:coiled-coil domain-containing protein 6
VNGHSGSGTAQRHLSASAEAEEVEAEAEPESSVDMLLEAMRRENEELRNKLADTQRGYMRISRLNEVYREELIEHRRRVRFLNLPSCQ